MLGDSTSVLATTATASTGGAAAGEAAAPPPPPPSSHQLPGGESVVSSEVGHVGSNNNSGEEDKRSGAGGGDEAGDRSFGGNRWPRQETLALLKIRSDMDVAFRDASVKGPLWDEVSRKLAELGYNRSAKKCKEKFENVFKYHKRTKEGRTGKHEGKTYRFFDQLEAFETHPPSSSQSQTQTLPPPPPPPQLKPQAPAVTTLAMPLVSPTPTASVGLSHISTVPSTTPAVLATNMSSHGIVTTGINLAIPSLPPSSTNPTILPLSQATNPTNLNPSSQANIQSSFPSFSPDLLSNSTSSSTSSDVEIHQGRRRRKRKWKDFFERLMKEVIHKQEDMQKRFLEAIEKREHDRMVREESWRMQEMARINREREILAQERSIAAAKDAAVMAFLQKLSEQQNPAGQQPQVQNNPSQQQQQPIQPPQPQPSAVAPPQSQSQPQPLPQSESQSQPAPVPQALPVATVAAAVPQPQPAAATINLETKSDNGDQSLSTPSAASSSSRWPKVEVQALINLRTNLDSKYQENAPKGPLWEEISAGMRKLGYNRNAKRCKEKWENINKYFKKVKESNKKRPEDAKTCPYFHQLDALYKVKHHNKFDFGIVNNSSSSPPHFQIMKPENINSVPLMVRPEQQWPPPSSHHHQQQQQQQEQGQHDSAMEDLESEDNQNHDQDDDDKDMDDDEEDEASGYEIVASRQTSMS